DWLARREATLANGARSRWLFVRPQQNRLGLAPYAYSTLIGRVRRLADAIRLKDSEGNPVAMTRTHQFRHAKATSLLNSGVPLSVIQRYLGHYAGDVVKAFCDEACGNVVTTYDRNDRTRSPEPTRRQCRGHRRRRWRHNNGGGNGAAPVVGPGRHPLRSHGGWR
ncbi:MAG: tyrosine-type recombinase/integrase, partial [Acidimicrobiales bacterium]